MCNEKSVTIVLSGVEYHLLLTTKALKEMGIRYGGIENIGNQLQSGEAGAVIGELSWIISTLANQTILIHNLQHKDDKRELLTEEEVELLMPADKINDYNHAVLDAINKGMGRKIQSENDESKNAVAG